MKLSISNIGWAKEYDEEMYKFVSEAKFEGLEIAPTRIIEKDPYYHAEEAKQFAKEINDKYNLKISSIQSIWYGKKGNIFNDEDAKKFIEYTKKAIDFASEINCKNLVFGCPKNRSMPKDKKEEDILCFFKELGDYAKEKRTVLAIEPNPQIYGTNFINYTAQAFSFTKKVNNEGIKVNVDFGTIIENKEDLNIIVENIDLVNHIHISEPNLEKIEKREEHKKFAEYLKMLNYKGYISIEMKNTNNIDDAKDIIRYVNEVFK